MVETTVGCRLTSRKLINMADTVMRKKKISAKTVAGKMGITDSTLSYRMRNDRFSLADFLSLCDVLGIELLWRETGFDDSSKIGTKSHRPDLRG